MVTEKTIDLIIGQFEADQIDYEQTARDFAEQQPAILSFLLSDQEGALTEDERDFTLYLATVIWRSVEHMGPSTDKVSAKRLSDAEEANWDLMGLTSGKNFRHRLDVFFNKTPQEDLLAFIEDSITPNEEGASEGSFPVTTEGAEPIFIALKTVVDVLTQG